MARSVSSRLFPGNDYFHRFLKKSESETFSKEMALQGVRVIEILGLAPGPYCGMILKEFGASVTVVQRTDGSDINQMTNGKKSISINLKSKDGAEVMKKLCLKSDILIDTFRPGVLEKLGLGPGVLLKENSKLIYASLTGYGQTGYYSKKAGHDINYVATSGVLSLLAKDDDPPQPPVNLLADFAGGGLMCAFGILLALINRSKTGLGQVVDNSMSEGSSYIASFLFRSRDLPIWGNKPGNNILDGGAPFYNTYKTKDGKFMAVGAIEPQFYFQLLKGLNLSTDDYSQFELEKCKKKFTEVFATKTQKEWCDIFDELDACVTPVVDFEDAAKHKHNSSRDAFITLPDSIPIPAPAPRLSSTPGISSVTEPKPLCGEHTLEILSELGYTHKEMKSLIENGDVGAHKKSSL